MLFSNVYMFYTLIYTLTLKVNKSETNILKNFTAQHLPSIVQLF